MKKILIFLSCFCFATSAGWGNPSKPFFSIARAVGTKPYRLLGAEFVESSAEKFATTATMNRILKQKTLQATPLNFNVTTYPVSLLATDRTGINTLETLVPAWRLQMAPLFSGEQIQLVTKAFANTDKMLFKEKEDNSLSLKGEEWDYAEHFAEELVSLANEQGIVFSEKQYKYLLGGKGAPREGLWMVLRLMSFEGWLLHSGQVYPRSTYWRDGKQVSVAQMSEEELAQRHLARGVDFLIRTGDPANPVISRLIYLREITRVNALMRSPQDWLDYLESWLQEHEGRFPRRNILKNGKLLSHEEMTGEEREEVLLTSGIERVLMVGESTDPAVIALKKYREENRVHSKHRTAEEWAVLLEAFVTQKGHLPRSIFYENGHALKAAELSAEQVEERKLNSAMFHLLSKGKMEDPAILRIKELHDQYLKRK